MYEDNREQAEVIVNLYSEFVNFLNEYNKTLDDIKYVILLKDNPEENSIVLKEDFIRLSKEIDYNMGYGSGKKINDDLLFIGEDFRIEILELEYFNFIEEIPDIIIPDIIDRNPQLYIEDDWGRKYFYEFLENMY